MPSSKPAHLVRSRDYARYLLEGGEPHSIIRVHNLSTEALIGGAIWGVLSDDGHRNVLQPVFVSGTLSLREPFKSAAQSDRLNESTVNYSLLSREILKVIASRRPGLPHSEEFHGLQTDWSIHRLIEWIQFWLTGYEPSGSRPPTSLISRYLDGPCPFLLEKNDPSYKPPMLDIESLSELGFTLFLPKATLLSSGVSLTASTIYVPVKAHRSVLKIHDIRIPTLIGVNKKERLAKQLIAASVEIDPYVCNEGDYYNELEQIIVKTTEESAFETLESLATHICDRIIKHFVYVYTPHLSLPYLSPSPKHFSSVRVSLGKPSAIMFADAPSVEILRSSNPDEDKDAAKLWAEYSLYDRGDPLRAAEIPYPLQGELSAWLAENDPGNST